MLRIWSRLLFVLMYLAATVANADDAALTSDDLLNIPAQRMSINDRLRLDQKNSWVAVSGEFLKPETRTYLLKHYSASSLPLYDFPSGGDYTQLSQESIVVLNFLTAIQLARNGYMNAADKILIDGIEQLIKLARVQSPWRKEILLSKERIDAVFNVLQTAINFELPDYSQIEKDRVEAFSQRLFATHQKLLNKKTERISSDHWGNSRHILFNMAGALVSMMTPMALLVEQAPVTGFSVSAAIGMAEIYAYLKALRAYHHPKTTTQAISERIISICDALLKPSGHTP